MLIALLTDFGLDDPYVGIMKAVMLGIAPGATFVDLTHAVPPQNVALGAWHLAIAAPYLPAGTMALAVVDPGVGTARRAVAVRAGGCVFVAPDNGLLTRVLAATPATAAVALDDPRAWRTATPSATFHGRDVFAPAAARLALGTALSDLGSAIDPATLTRLALPTPVRHADSTLTAHVIAVDHFGNLITDLGPDLAADLFAADTVSAQLGGWEIAARAATFGPGPADAPFWYPDSSGHAAIAWRHGHAAARLGAQAGDAITLRMGIVTPPA